MKYTNWKTRKGEIVDENPYKDTKVTNFGGKPLSEYKNEIKKDDRYINKMRHYSNKK